VNDALQDGLRLYHQGSYEQALYFLEDIDPLQEPDAAYYQALSYSKLGRAAEALQALDLVLVQETNFLKLVQAKMIRAFLLTTERRYVEAEQALRVMMDEGIESVQVYCNYGYVLWALDRAKEGIAWLNKALAKDPDNPNALNSMGYILAEQGVLLDKALSFCRRALALRKDNPPYLDSMGWVYHKMGLEKQALASLQKAVEAEPDNVDFRIHLVEVERALGKSAAPEGRKL
jgi:tetratricopeptide (TPR) repeat protein